ncbi:MAG: UDP-N-acetylmuramoyl-L-alanyl-D-glutamate--2,6-diaminopimelate ligase [Candidatus Omnitrophota bacterium]
MKIRDILPNQIVEGGIGNLKIKGISDDTRLAAREEVFFVKKTNNFDIFSALKGVESKVAAFVIERKDAARLKDLRKPVVPVDNIDNALTDAAEVYYGICGRPLKIIGITGTNGKTTTTYLIHSLLKRLGKTASLIGTTGYFIGKIRYKATHTTPDFLTLRKLLYQSSVFGCEYAVIEVSSHAIDQKRIKGIEFSCCVFTNLSRDHLDYHGGIPAYFKAKRQLFIANPKAALILNADDNYGKRLIREFPSALSYGLNKDADIRAVNLTFTKNGTFFDLLYKGDSIRVKSKFLGTHNVFNTLASTGVLLSLGAGLKDIVSCLPFAKAVEGRLERIEANVFVDYAHSPDALKNVLRTLRKVNYDKIVCVFGCGGDRDRGKRKLMGKVASTMADFTFITSDNPRTESASEICKEIEKGFNKNNYSVILSRKVAINKAMIFSRKYKNSCVLVAGKGHEDYQIIGNKKIKFKDKDAIRSLLRNIRDNETRTTSR